MSIPLNYRPIVKQVAQHEAGHYVVARVLGFKVGEISLMMTDFRGGHEAGSTIGLAMPLRTVEDSIQYLESRIQILYAGALSEALQNGEIDNALATASLNTGGGARDFGKIQELMNLIRNLKSPDAFGEGATRASLSGINNELYNRAAEAVMCEKDIIDGLAARITSDVRSLNQRVVISEQELLVLPDLVARFGEAHADNDEA